MITEWLTPLLTWLGVSLDSLLLIVAIIILIIRGD